MNSPNEERDPRLAETAHEQASQEHPVSAADANVAPVALPGAAPAAGVTPTPTPTPGYIPPAGLAAPAAQAPWSGAVAPPLAEPGGTRWTNRSRDPRRKSSLLAVLMSLMPGLGQVYVGHYKRGFIHILVVATLITLLAENIGPLAPLAGLGLAFFWLYNMVDAGRRATYYNQLIDAQAGGSFPEDIEFPGGGGSRAGGVVLIVLGCAFLMHTRFDWNFYWLEEWWPLGFVLLGGYLVYKDRQGSKSDESEQ